MKQELQLEFPCKFPIKVVGKACCDLESIVVPIVRKHVPNLGEGCVSTRPSKGNKFLSITVEFTATSKKQLDNLYTEISANPNVIMAL